MRRQRLTITATLLALAGLSMAPTFASAAGPLLSGYGGPGQGNQAILGSAVVNGGSGGGSKGSGGGGSGSSSSGSSSLSAAAGNSVAGAGSATSSAGTDSRSAAGAGTNAGAPAPAASHSSGKQAKPTLAGTSKTGAAASGGSSSLTASRGAVGGSQTLGLSGADLLYVLLAFGVLVFTGLLTRSLARDPSGPGRQATKAMRRSTRVSS
jgi:hypothetical protein